MENIGSIGVVIPYYQVNSGVLLKAVKSIFTQTYSGSVIVYIIDDGSPVSAKDELLNVTFPDNIILTIIEQENGGPSSARNHALKLAKNDDCQFIAYLDSDDEWEPIHLENAIYALNQGSDFYFSNYMQLDATESVFEKSKITLSNHTLLNSNSALYQYTGDMFEQVIVNPIIGTPTVVYNLEAFGHLFFDETFLKAREDHLLWLDIALTKANFCFGASIELRCGRGVNIWASTKWGSDNLLSFYFHDIKFSKQLLSKYPLTPQQINYVKQKLSTLRHAVFLDFVHRLGHHKKIDFVLLYKLLKLDVLSFISMPYFSFKYLFFRKQV